MSSAGSSILTPRPAGWPAAAVHSTAACRVQRLFSGRENPEPTQGGMTWSLGSSRRARHSASDPGTVAMDVRASPPRPAPSRAQMRPQAPGAAPRTAATPRAHGQGCGPGRSGARICGRGSDRRARAPGRRRRGGLAQGAGTLAFKTGLQGHPLQGSVLTK